MCVAGFILSYVVCNYNRKKSCKKCYRASYKISFYYLKKGKLGGSGIIEVKAGPTGVNFNHMTGFKMEASFVFSAIIKPVIHYELGVRLQATPPATSGPEMAQDRPAGKLAIDP